MDQAYWLRRKHASLLKANEATSARARLIHFDLAGRRGAGLHLYGQGLIA